MERELKEKKVVTFGCSWTAGDEIETKQVNMFMMHQFVILGHMEMN